MQPSNVCDSDIERSSLAQISEKLDNERWHRGRVWTLGCAEKVGRRVG